MKKSIPVMYMGERGNFLGKIFQLFKDREGNTYHFTRIRGVYFGDIYEMFSDKTIKLRPKSLEVKNWAHTNKEYLENEAQKIAVRGYRLEAKKVMKLKKPHPDVIQAVNLLRPFIRTMGITDSHRFMDWVKNEASKSKK